MKAFQGIGLVVFFLVAAESVAAQSVAGMHATETYLLGRLERDGLAAAMASLDSLSRVDPEVRRLGHLYAHSLGLAAYTDADQVDRVFASCTPIFQSGCHHGVIQSYFGEHAREHGSHFDAALVNALCQELRGEDSDGWLLFQCVHGLGHGLMMVVDHHLPQALGGCDLLNDGWEREVCYGAVFMENIVHATMPHHIVGRPDAAADQGAHAHHAPTAIDPPQAAFPALRREEPLYPCTVLESRYLNACYQMQTSAVLQLNGQDVATAARACMSAPELFMSTCFQSLGRDISALTVQDHSRALRLCRNAPADFEPSCHFGYAKNLVDQTSRPEDGFAFCRLLEAAASKRACYVGIGEQIRVLRKDPSARAELCAGAEPEYVAECGHGAQLGGRPLSRGSIPERVERPDPKG